jgi:hypothetical protein
MFSKLKTQFRFHPLPFAFLVCIFILHSCATEQQDWLEGYKDIKCKYFSTQERLKVEKTAKSAQLTANKLNLETTLVNTFKAETDSIKLLEGQLVYADKEEKYQARKRRDKHSTKHGASAKMESERVALVIQRTGGHSVDQINYIIQKIKAGLQTSAQYNELSKSIEKVKADILASDKVVDAQFKKEVDGLQQTLDIQNKQFKLMYSGLDTVAQKKVVALRDSVKAHPCK